MSGTHGSSSAPGARAAVLSAPLRRALLLAAAVAGVLFTGWLASPDPASADEIPGVVPAVDEVIGRTAAVEDPLTTAVTGADDGLDDVAAVPDTPLPLVSVTPAAEMAEHVLDTVGDVYGGGADRARPKTAPEPVEPGPVTEAPAPEPAAAVVERDDPGTAPASVGDTAAEGAVSGDAATPEPSAGSAGSTEGAQLSGGERAPQHGGSTSAPSSASSGAPAVAAHLPTAGAPAPEPGQVQAARHVLRSVPAENADEPTFSPD
ncbi:hypothetical protein [Nocardiopsis algeriensis]|uniref:Meckel syndrome type 1 protein n=1 Tax=Nocardiopsis algeriensis TaxID=1478215 RepID=A0A841IZE2_9ACTN|nr:hypothetical protein [Nocardiopsis algeriensis]MBB6121628.1 hypothetical protein [Nocardiopsis algeriensis]